MTTTPGIDVSRWQGDINWEMVASAGYRFAVIRATAGETYTDPDFTRTGLARTTRVSSSPHTMC